MRRAAGTSVPMARESRAGLPTVAVRCAAGAPQAAGRAASPRRRLSDPDSASPGGRCAATQEGRVPACGSRPVVQW